MSAYPHTPGPWSIKRSPSHNGFTVVVRGEPAISVFAAYGEREEERQAVAEANARLISKAPDMIDALRAAERFISGFEGDELQEDIDDLLATIRTAIGGAA